MGAGGMIVMTMPVTVAMVVSVMLMFVAVVRMR